MAALIAPHLWSSSLGFNFIQSSPSRGALTVRTSPVCEKEKMPCILSPGRTSQQLGGDTYLILDKSGPADPSTPPRAAQKGVEKVREAPVSRNKEPSSVIVESGKYYDYRTENTNLSVTSKRFSHLSPAFTKETWSTTCIICVCFTSVSRQYL
jgi:hypothetical protein